VAGSDTQVRCSLSGTEAKRLGGPNGWRCSVIEFEIAEVGFDRFDRERAAKLSSIPTRLRLATEDVDFLIQSGTDAILNHPTLDL
jgi:hypothetical protein